MITLKSKGDFSKTESYLKKSRKITRINNKAVAIADLCVDRLRKATPIDSGLTAESWDYKITIDRHKTIITFLNKNVQDGVNIALMIELGHGTPSGVWVEGKDYIAPVIQQTYLEVVDNTWKELTRA